MVTEVPEALNLITKHCSQPLDLTKARNESDVEVIELDPTDLNLDSHDLLVCVCGKSCTTYEQYMDHISSCNKSRLTPYKVCDICGKYFFSSSGYVKHKRLHVGAYKFRCSVCHKGFFDRTHLTAHMDSTHSKVRRYECEHCGKSFFWKHHLKRHRGTCDKAKGRGFHADAEAALESLASDTDMVNACSKIEDSLGVSSSAADHAT